MSFMVIGFGYEDSMISSTFSTVRTVKFPNVVSSAETTLTNINSYHKCDDYKTQKTCFPCTQLQFIGEYIFLDGFHLRRDINNILHQ